MDEIVLDASALLALINSEPGGELVARSLPSAVISSVNVAEVITKLASRGLPETEVRGYFGRLDLNIIPFDEEQAYEAGFIVALTKDYGLSLGDRACLGLARSRGLTALTADRAWKRLSLAKVKVVR
ncbi:MAG: type II toxin-antitoxin system VapC family toxin [Chloroflexi bacterium]|nr:type II toxin-antitoxin system VapC family toxin [Chloroflexota bacterium]